MDPRQNTEQVEEHKKDEFYQLYSDVGTTSESDSEHQQRGLAPVEVTPEMLASIVKQVEFYFSDANLPTDKKLLKLIRRDSHGFVPVKLFGNFRKIRALTRDVEVIASALKDSKELQLSEDYKYVRRIVPIPVYNIDEIQKRILVVENLPPTPTIDSVTEMFAEYGSIKVVRICAKESKGKLPSWLTGGCMKPNQQHAFVEFEEEAAAVRAAAAVYSPDDSRVHMRIQRLTTQLASQDWRDDSGGGSNYRRGGGSLRTSRDPSPNFGNRYSRTNHQPNGPGQRSLARSSADHAGHCDRSERLFNDKGVRRRSGGGVDGRSWTHDSAPATKSTSLGGSRAASPPHGSGLDMWHAHADGMAARQLPHGAPVLRSPSKAGVYIPPARRSQEGSPVRGLAGSAPGAMSPALAPASPVSARGAEMLQAAAAQASAAGVPANLAPSYAAALERGRSGSPTRSSTPGAASAGVIHGSASPVFPPASPVRLASKPADSSGDHEHLGMTAHEASPQVIPAAHHSAAKPHIPKAPVHPPSPKAAGPPAAPSPSPQAAPFVPPTASASQLTTQAALSAMLADVLAAAEQKQREMDVANAGTATAGRKAVVPPENKKRAAPKFCLDPVLNATASNEISAALRAASGSNDGGVSSRGTSRGVSPHPRPVVPVVGQPAASQKVENVDSFINMILAGIPAASAPAVPAAATQVATAPGPGTESQQGAAAEQQQIIPQHQDDDAVPAEAAKTSAAPVMFHHGRHLSVVSEGNELERLMSAQMEFKDLEHLLPTAEEDTLALDASMAAAAALGGIAAVIPQQVAVKVTDGEEEAAAPRPEHPEAGAPRDLVSVTAVAAPSQPINISKPPIPAHHMGALSGFAAISSSAPRDVARHRLVMSEGGAGSPASLSSSDEEGEQGINRGVTEGGLEGGEGMTKRRRRRRRSHSKRSSEAGVGAPGQPTTVGSPGISSGGADAGDVSHVVTFRQRRVSDGSTAAGLSPGSELVAKQKKPSKKDYAIWAAATPEYRAEAAAKFGAADTGVFVHVRSAMSPTKGVISKVSDSGAPVAGPGGRDQPPYPVHGEHHQNVVHISKGPDGSRGFGMGRGRPLAPPPS